jgi:predicted dehydrogenase
MTIAQCQALAETMRRYGRVFQAGTHRRNIGHCRRAVELALSGKLGKLHTLHAAVSRPWETHDWLPAEPQPDKNIIDWDLWLGPSPWRPFNHKYVDGDWRHRFDFDSGAGLLDWGAHTVDLCQWANRADGTTPVEFEPVGDTIVGRYANGVKLILRAKGWPQLGFCPVRFEGDEGWVETGDNGRFLVHPESLQTGPVIAAQTTGPDREEALYGPGISPKYHVRDFFNCVKSRAMPAANAEVSRKSHVACHAAYIAWLLGRRVAFDPAKEEFVGDEAANRMRSRALREPWRV